MKIGYLVKFRTNYEESGIVLITKKNINYVKEKVEALGAWDGYTITELEEEFYYSINFGDRKGEIK